jgi:hypothetical protein
MPGDPAEEQDKDVIQDDRRPYERQLAFWMEQVNALQKRIHELEGEVNALQKRIHELEEGQTRNQLFKLIQIY